jgi:tryptophan-rich sensory protein
MAFNGVWSQILIFAAAAVVFNILWFVFQWYRKSGAMEYKRNKLIPPGWFIAIVWVVLFGLLGYSHWLVRDANEGKASLASIAIIVVGVWCLLYPIFVYLVGYKYVRLVNLLSLIVVFTLGLIIITESEKAFYWTIPLIFWNAYINFADSMYCSNNLATI